MKYVFVVLNRNLGSLLVYDASEVTIEALIETFHYTEYHIEHLPINITV